MQFAGTFSIPNLAEGGTVTGLALGSTFFPPNVPNKAVHVFPRVRKPPGGFNMFANVIDGTITPDGFQFSLSGQTDNANYALDYLIV